MKAAMILACLLLAGCLAVARAGTAYTVLLPGNEVGRP